MMDGSYTPFYGAAYAREASRHVISHASGSTLASRSPKCCRQRRFLSLPQPLGWGRRGHCQGSTIGRRLNATKHFRASGHPIIEGYDPPEGWGWCYVDETFIELDHPTQQLGPIPRFAP